MITNPRQWEPVDAPLQNKPGERSAAALVEVVTQFDVEKNPRYRRTGTSTFCNIFSWDVTRALCCEIPHWVSDPTRKKGRRELNANDTLEWLLEKGPAAGWRELLKGDAGLRASAGFPTVVAWANPNPARSGHIAILLPSRGAEIRIAQAGARNVFDAPLDWFGAVKPLRFFTHD